MKANIESNRTCDEAACKTVTCANCSEAVEAGDTTEFGGEAWCENCLSDNTFICECCNNRAHDNECITVDGRPWCESCASSHSSACDCCGERAPDRDMSSDGTSAYCEPCMGHYYTCEACSGFVHEDNVQHVNDSPYCESCAAEQDAGPIYHWSYRPKFQRYGQGMMLGVELEVECRCHSHNKAEAISADHRLYCKHDGSLDDGFEIVTHPCSLEMQRTVWKGVVEHRNGLASWDGGTCGLHVHIERKGLSQLQIAKTVCFVHANSNHSYIVGIAGRSGSSWAKKFEKPLAIANRATGQRYEAINLCNRRTIEFRIFKGTLLLSSLIRNIEFCHALVSFCSPAGQSLKSSQSLDRFKTYVNQNKKTYPQLNTYHQGGK